MEKIDLKSPHIQALVEDNKKVITEDEVVITKKTSKKENENVPNRKHTKKTVNSIAHSKVLSTLLNEIVEIEFREASELEDGIKLTQKHYRIICIDKLLALAKNRKWGLCIHHSSIYMYNGSYWAIIEDSDFKTFLGFVAEKMGVDLFDSKSFEFRDKLIKQFETSANLIRPVTDSEKITINLSNGSLDIIKGELNLRRFERNDFITYQLPFAFNEGSECPIFINYLEKVLPDKDSQMILSEYLGYLFLNSKTLKLEKALFLYGDGSNGKSVFYDVVNALLGNENVSSYSLENLTDTNGYYRAKIENKLVNYASEVSSKMNTTIFKQLVSGEPVEARLPYKDPFTLKEYGKFIFNSNSLPVDTEDTHAFFRRFLILPFKVEIKESEKDVHLAQKIITTELSGVFNWVITGLNRLILNEQFTESQEVRSLLDEFRKKRNSVQMFVEEIEYKASTEGYVYLKEAYDEYKTFCIDDTYRPVSKSNFKERLEKLSLFNKKMSGGIVVLMQKPSLLS